jgi:predicted aspartyl protease
MPAKSNTKLIVAAVVLVAVTCGGIVVCAVLAPVVIQARREAARRDAACEQLRRIGEALRNYQAAKRGTPVMFDGESGSNAERRVSFPKDKEHIILPVNVNGRFYPFTLDTGCGEVAFARSLTGELGAATGKAKVLLLNGGPLSENGRLAEAEIHLPPKELSVGSLAIDVPEVYAFEYPSSHGALQNESSGGLLGMTLLKKYSVEIDFNSGEVLFKEPRRDAAATTGFSVKLSKIEPVPFVRVDVSGVEVEMMLDTGQPGPGYLAHDLFEEVIRRTKQKPALRKAVELRGDVADLSRVVETVKTLSASVSVAGLEYTQIVLADRDKSILGMGFLKTNSKVVFDFPNGRLYLVPRVVGQCNLAALGMSVRADGGSLLVCNLDKAGVAYRQGLREGDALLKVNGRGTLGMSLSDLSRLITQELARGLTFTAKRGDQTREHVLSAPSPSKRDERPAGR